MKHQNCFLLQKKILGRAHQGYLFANSMYVYASILLIGLLDGCLTVKKCYADDGNFVNSLDNLKKFVDLLKEHGPAIG